MTGVSLCHELLEWMGCLFGMGSWFDREGL